MSPRVLDKHSWHPASTGWQHEGVSGRDRGRRLQGMHKSLRRMCRMRIAAVRLCHPRRSLWWGLPDRPSTNCAASRVYQDLLALVPNADLVARCWMRQALLCVHGLLTRHGHTVYHISPTRIHLVSRAWPSSHIACTALLSNALRGASHQAHRECPETRMARFTAL